MNDINTSAPASELAAPQPPIARQPRRPLGVVKQFLLNNVGSFFTPSQLIEQTGAADPTHQVRDLRRGRGKLSGFTVETRKANGRVKSYGLVPVGN